MKLKTFDRVNVAVQAEYTVWDRKTDALLDNFYVDFAKPYPDDGITKVLDLIHRGADIQYVRVNSASGLLDVTVIV